MFRLAVLLTCLVVICKSVVGEVIGDDVIEWTTKPQHTAIVRGQDLILDCHVRFPQTEDTPAFDVLYQWSHNEEPARSKTSIFSNHSLLVPQVDAEDVGSYTCLVTLLSLTGSTLTTQLSASATVIEAYIEPFLISPQSAVLNQGDEVILTCVTGSNAPSLEVYWTRNGEKITEGDQLTASYGDYDLLDLRQQLSMRFATIVSHENVGQYRCVAVNQVLGKQVLSLEANVTLKSSLSDDKPQLEWTVPEQMVIPEGQDLVLSCKSQVSTEPVTVEWFRGRYLIDESKRVFVLLNSSLAFSPLSSRDAGNYRCELSNSKGTTSSPEVQLIIAYLDTKFKEEPTDTLALYGQNVMLPCQPPSSLPEASVLWYKDYAVFDSAARSAPASVHNDGSLHLTSVSISDQGQYYCVAINSMTQPSTRTSRIARLSVEGPPEIIEPPIGTKLLRGTLLHLTCRSVANPMPTVSWSFEGKPVSVSDRISIMDKGQQLWITNIGQEWNGNFSCHCTNKYGSISIKAAVTVIVPPSTLRPIGKLHVKTGDNVTISCPIVGVPQPAIRWFHNGSEISSTQHSNAAASENAAHMRVHLSQLIIDHVTPHHSGVYTCKGNNEGGVASSNGQVVVYVPPYLTKRPESTVIILQHSLSLVCEAGGNPTPSIQWKFNNSLTSVAGTLTANNTTLTIAAFKWEHVGSYTCVANNIVGTATSIATVKIMIPPVISKVTHPDSPVKTGHHLRLSCHSTGIPPPSISWSHQELPISPSLDGRIRIPSSGVLEIESTTLYDSGQYACVVISQAGTDRKEVTVVVYGPPNPPELINAVPLSPASVYLIWSWSGSQQNDQFVNGFKVFIRERTREEVSVYPQKVLPNTTHLEVRELRPATAYVFHMVAINDAGQSFDSNLLTATTLTSEPSSPVNLKTEEVTPVSATLLWEIPSSPNGVVKLYQLRYKRLDSKTGYKLVNITSDASIPTQEYQLLALRPYFEYMAQVRAATVHLGTEMWGNYSAVLTFRTSMSQPVLPPQNVQVDVLDGTSATVSWENIRDLAQNGPTVQYHIMCVQSNSNTVVTQTKTNRSVSSISIHRLHPWRQYTVTLTGENPVGIGPASKPVSFRTHPIAPITIPRNLIGQPASSTSIKFSWKPLPEEVITCPISSYEIRLRVQGSSQWKAISVPSSMTKHIAQQLLPWTLYEFKIAAFTNSVSPGLGPFTEPITIKTMEGESGPVTALSYSSKVTSVALTWRPASDVKGILIGYSVIYSLVGSKEPQQMIKRLNLPKETTFAHINGLLPNSLYNISISAVNGAGIGRASVLFIKTEPYITMTPVPETTYTTESVSMETTFTAMLQQQAQTDHVKKNLAAIVAGSLVGGISLIIISVFFCIKCKQYRRNQRLNYEYHAYFNQGYTTQVL